MDNIKHTCICRYCGYKEDVWSDDEQYGYHPVCNSKHCVNYGNPIYDVADKTPIDVSKASFAVGEKVYAIKRTDQIFSTGILKHPEQKKITQIVPTKNGFLYQVKGYHFSEDWIGKIIFKTPEEANAAIQNR